MEAKSIISSSPYPPDRTSINEVYVTEQIATLTDDPEKVIYHSVVVYSFDDAMKAFTAHSFLPDGQQRISQLQIQANRISWLAMNGQARFTIEVNEQGHYISKAVYIKSGEQFFEMMLYPRSND